MERMSPGMSYNCAESQLSPRLTCHAGVDVRVYEARHQALPRQVHLGDVRPGEEVGGLAEVSHMEDPLVLRHHALGVLGSVAAHQENVAILVKDQHAGDVNVLCYRYSYGLAEMLQSSYQYCTHSISHCIVKYFIKIFTWAQSGRSLHRTVKYF